MVVIVMKNKQAKLMHALRNLIQVAVLNVKDKEMMSTVIITDGEVFKVSIEIKKESPEIRLKLAD